MIDASRQLSSQEASLIREALSYDPATGEFQWRKSLSNRAAAGASAGSVQRDGYLKIGFGGVSWLAHRLAWFFGYGQMPVGHIDHVNGIRADNRLDNLRLCDNKLNNQNRKLPARRNKVGLLGVSELPNRAKPYRAVIQSPGGRQIHVGYYATPEAAHAAYVSAKRRLHQGCTL